MCKCGYAKCVYCIAVKDRGNTCKHIERKGSVNCFDDRGSATESDDSTVQ